MRKLATIRQISNIEPIDGADKIELATIDGWQCVVGKGEFNKDDLCVYFEIDSILPVRDCFEFMAKRHYRVKTAKFLKQISQGLVMSINDIVLVNGKKITKYNLGDDVTELIGITKHDPQVDKEFRGTSRKKLNPIISWMFRYEWFRRLYPSKARKTWPLFIKKTDEERIQNMPSYIKHTGLVYITEKLDGTSATYFYNKHKFGVCSRNIWLQRETNNKWWHIAKLYGIKNKLKSCKRSIYIQGEIIGQGIQKNRYNIKDVDFYVFNVVDIKTNTSYNFKELQMFCNNYNFKMVPSLFTGMVYLKELFPNQSLLLSLQEIIEFSGKDNSKLANVLREGIVVRDAVSNDINKLSFKVVNPHFLLKHGE